MTAIYLAYFDSYLPGWFWQTFTWPILTLFTWPILTVIYLTDFYRRLYLADFDSYLLGRLWQPFTWPTLTAPATAKDIAIKLLMKPSQTIGSKQRIKFLYGATLPR